MFTSALTRGTVPAQRPRTPWLRIMAAMVAKDPTLGAPAAGSSWSLVRSTSVGCVKTVAATAATAPAAKFAAGFGGPACISTHKDLPDEGNSENWTAWLLTCRLPRKHSEVFQQQSPGQCNNGMKLVSVAMPWRLTQEVTRTISTLSTMPYIE